MKASSNGPRIASVLAILLLSCALALTGCGTGTETQTAAPAGDPGKLGFDTDSPVDQLGGAPATATPAAAPATTSPTGATAPTAVPPPPAPATTPATPAAAPKGLTAAYSARTMHRYLGLYRTNQVAKAKAMVTPRFIEAAGPGYFRPTNGAFVSYKIDKVETLPGGIFAIWVTEQWNSGPEKVKYTVAAKGGKPVIDMIEWSQY